MNRSFAAYLTIMVATIMLVCAFVFGVNWLVDPLWYHGGNRLTGENFRFDERAQKINALLPEKGAYDCIIFGSSRTVVLPASAIPGHRCFNLAFSAGTMEEFVPYAAYLKSIGMDPKIIIIGVDDFQFYKGDAEMTVPSFITQKKPPRSVWLSYLTLDAFGMSLHALMGASGDEWMIGRNLEVSRLQLNKYDPQTDKSGLIPAQSYNVGRSADYAKIRALFPTAQMVGYVPPLSAWRIANMRKAGALDAYLDIIRQAAQHFDRFNDFGVPSEITADPANSYDGSHYSPAINHAIAAVLIEGDASPALDLKHLSREEVEASYLAALEKYQDGMNQRTR